MSKRGCRGGRYRHFSPPPPGDLLELTAFVDESNSKF